MWAVLLGVLVVVALVWTLFPFWRVAESWDAEYLDEEGVRELRQQKARLLRFLKDLELERETATLDEEEYQALWDEYAREVALVNQRLAAVDVGRKSSGARQRSSKTGNESEPAAESAASGPSSESE